LTGTGTAIGKTVTTAAIVACLRAQVLRVVVAKPTQTGMQPGQPGERHDVCRLAAEVETHEFVRLPDPLAPDAVGRLAGVDRPSVADQATKLAEIARRDDVDLLLVEGVGGLLVRSNLTDLSSVTGARFWAASPPALGDGAAQSHSRPTLSTGSPSSRKPHGR